MDRVADDAVLVGRDVFFLVLEHSLTEFIVGEFFSSVVCSTSEALKSTTLAMDVPGETKSKWY